LKSLVDLLLQAALNVGELALKIRYERLEFTHVWRNEVLNNFLDGLGDVSDI